MDYRRFIRKAPRLFGVAVLLLIAAAGIRAFIQGSQAEASDLFMYPEFCLGGWENPQKASGPSEAPSEKADAGNSAYLESSIASQIFCGYFNVEKKDRPPKHVSITFNLSVKGGKVAPLPMREETRSEPQHEGTLETPTEDKADGTPAFRPEEVETSPESLPYGEVAPSESASKEEVDSHDAPDSSQGSEGSDPSSGAYSPGSPNGQESPDSPEESALLNFFFGKPLYAEGEFLNPILDVSYSTDGIRWKSIGKINAANWKEHTVSVPFESWENLEKLQVMLNVIPTPDEKPDIYLESIGLKIDYDRTFGEAAQDGIETVVSAADTVLDAVGNMMAAVGTAVVGSATPIPAEPASVPQAPIVKQTTKLAFEKVSEEIKTSRTLPWYDELFRNRLLAEKSSYPHVEFKDNKEDPTSFVVEGTCKKSYFVILTFKEKEDYLERPATFTTNFADVCKDGRFSYNLNSIPPNTPEGTYYLLVAEQEEVGPWVPASSLVPIRIWQIVEEEVITE